MYKHLLRSFIQFCFITHLVLRATLLVGFTMGRIHCAEECGTLCVCSNIVNNIYRIDNKQVWQCNDEDVCLRYLLILARVLLFFIQYPISLNVIFVILKHDCCIHYALDICQIKIISNNLRQWIYSYTIQRKTNHLHTWSSQLCESI